MEEQSPGNQKSVSSVCSVMVYLVFQKEAIMFRKILKAALITLAFVFGVEGLKLDFPYNILPVESTRNVHAKDAVPPCSPPIRVYGSGDERTSAMVRDERAQQLAELEGLNIVNVTWEDTGRFYNSSVGPNISDVTIQVQHRDPVTCDYRLTLMPVIRNPNFSDLTADIPLDRFYLLIGNERGDELYRISLEEYLGDFRKYLSDPDSWRGRGESLLAKRDTHVLVSAQAAFLPVPQEGIAEFNPVLFNYQSSEGDPAVLTIVATREGTSATIIDNVRDAFPAGWSWGQRLFFNQAGQRASFTGERLSDFDLRAQPSGGNREDSTGEGLNMVMVIQVPLKQKQKARWGFDLLGGTEMAPAIPMAAESASDIEEAVIGHGEVDGPFTEIDGLKIERDERFPIRVTVQFYKATSNGIISEEDMQEIAGEIERVYSDADYVGSLVVGGGSNRPTEYDGVKVEPEGWWGAFWGRFEKNTGLDEFDARELWGKLGTYTGWWGILGRENQ
jgi:hypothetical protein